MASTAACAAILPDFNVTSTAISRHGGIPKSHLHSPPSSLGRVTLSVALLWKQHRTVRRRSEAVSFSRGSGGSSSGACDVEYVVVNFYKFVWIEDPRNEVVKHLSFLKVWTMDAVLFFGQENAGGRLSFFVKDLAKFL